MKNRRLLTVLGIVLALLICVQGVNAQDGQLEKIGQTGFQFLKIDAFARSAGMAGAVTMAGTGVEAIFSNPAGISEMQAEGEFLFSRTMWFADMTLNSAGLARSFGNIGVFGFSFVSIDYGDVYGTKVADNAKGYEETGLLDVGAYALGISYGRSLTDKFKVGGQVKFANQKLGSNLIVVDSDSSIIRNEVSTVAYDFGTIFYPGFHSFRFGMSVRNFSPQIKFEEEAFELPLTFRIGVAMDMFDFVSGLSNQSLVLGIDALHPRDYSERIHVGAEYMYSDLIALRAGYKFNYDEEGLNLGFGLNYGIGGVDVKFDYSYTSFGIFDGVNRFTIGGTF